MTRTVTYDETQWKLVPLYIEENQVDKGVMGYLGCTADELKKIDHEQLTRCEQLIINAYVDCVDAAPPYPESNFVESLDSWIPVSERLPDHRGSVLCYTVCNGGTAYIKQERLNPAKTAFYVEHDGDEPCEKITHWMPLPSAPRGEE